MKVKKCVCWKKRCLDGYRVLELGLRLGFGIRVRVRVGVRVRVRD